MNTSRPRAFRLYPNWSDPNSLFWCGAVWLMVSILANEVWRATGQSWLVIVYFITSMHASVFLLAQLFMRAQRILLGKRDANNANNREE